MAKISNSNNTLNKSKLKKQLRKTNMKDEDQVQYVGQGSLESIGLLIKNPFMKDPKINKDQLQLAISAIFDVSIRNEDKSKLFDDEQAIFLQVACVKVPQVPTHVSRLSLPNSLYSEESEICLIASDLKHKSHKDYDAAISYYENLLKQKKVRNIKSIIPLHQLKNEYGTYESKRRLVELHDLFLVEGKISGKVNHLLGKIFITKRKLPTPIKLNVPNLNAQVSNALSKTLLRIHSKGDTYIVQIGTTKMQKEKISENVLTVVNELDAIFPGGWKNILGLHLKTCNSISIPIYVNWKNKNEVEVSVIKPKRPKACKPVIGELSCRNSEVQVYPDGNVKIVSKRANNEKNQKITIKKNNI